MTLHFGKVHIKKQKKTKSWFKNEVLYIHGSMHWFYWLNAVLKIITYCTFMCLFSGCSLAPGCDHTLRLIRMERTKKRSKLNKTVKKSHCLYAHTCHAAMRFQCLCRSAYKCQLSLINSLQKAYEKEVHRSAILMGGVIYKCLSKRSWENPLHHVVTVKGLLTENIRSKLSCLWWYCFWTSPKMACWRKCTTHRATPVMICEGSGCSSDCLGSRELVSAPHSSRESGVPGGQNGMYRIQEAVDKEELMPKGRL